MSGSKRSDYEASLRALKVDVPSELRVQLKREAVELDIPIRRYVRQILEERLPWDVRRKVEASAKRENMDVQQYLMKALRQAGALDDK
ncbi:hypothetical protein [Polyangium jinanense]|uniref:Uncharacterized protein n=1 Tax=Polyangium jinanense TaxID=2829994 RepID=A0A9X3X8W1_9BACT|nr:hypothetical protein [Polyangium jinanense]MDC3984508.1 hypothetical protein [Polyangium jinanense]